MELVHFVDCLIDPISTLMPFNELLRKLSVVMFGLRNLMKSLVENAGIRYKRPYSIVSDSILTRFGSKLVWMSEEENKVWKFTQRYSEEAHIFAHNLGIAPCVKFVTELPGNWKLVEMDLAPGDFWDPNNVPEIPPEHLETFWDGIGKFHELYVHGDLRAQNLLYSREHGFSIIDFDWSGEVNKARYPANMNHIDITWPAGAEPTRLITVDHDNWWLKQLQLPTHQ